MGNVKIRKTSLIAIIIVVASFFGFKMLSNMKKAPHKDSGKAKIIKVDVISVNNEDITADITINGRLHAKNKIDIFTEVTGRLLSTGKSFKDGVKYDKGELLLKLDDSNYRMSLNASRSNFQSLLMQLLAEIKIEYSDDFPLWESYITDFKPEERIKEFPEITNKKEKNYLVSKNIYTQYYNIKSQEAQLDKYTITAPFTGIIKNANLNPNSIIRAGQKLAEFINPNVFELEVGVNLSEISKIKIGDKVTLQSNDIEGKWEGVIKRIGESLDEKTMNFKIYIEVVSNQLFEGMYLKGIISSFEIKNVAKIPSNLINKDQIIYIVRNDSLLHFQKVQSIHESGNYALIRGLEDGAKIINHSVANAYEGMKVTL